ncbi:hypothetical protein KL86DYS2_12511 [uncultured Dysgonomonas sp.]|uniref:Uncharacterized protein n=1 Tax=uncultured Dysgonomonas sp. TaxID=206096 RepID=A0A212JWT8_9BACT|nr:hypothetical protein [uncultured Dysgonomonas sp.]SBW03863.1 hypothetical protein KL86DYS2_12511 [uncultured Dysgonomonas sp.]
MEPVSEVRKEQIEECVNTIVNIASKDTFHLNSVTKQIDTLGVMTMDLLEKNENRINDSLIGLFYHIGKSLRQLEDLQKLNQDE